MGGSGQYNEKAMNSFGHNFRITLFGESHGTVAGITIDGVPPGITLCADDFRTDMERRRGHTAVGTTRRSEHDTPRIISGIYKGHTTGAPVTILFENNNVRSKDYDNLRHHPRPSHADLTASIKYGGFNDPRGGGIFSGRMTAGIVAAGVVAKRVVAGIHFSTRIAEVGGLSDREEINALLTELQRAGDSAGGIVELCADGVPAGLGEPFFDSVESLAAHLLFSIPGVKGVEFGAGFDATRRRGSENNDRITDASGNTATNNDGGINGGITNGNQICLRVAFKPTASISLPQQTFDFQTGELRELSVSGRHDACIAIRGAVVAESVLAITLADLILRRNGYKG